jgi:hypothetical protein
MSPKLGLPLDQVEGKASVLRQDSFGQYRTKPNLDLGNVLRFIGHQVIAEQQVNRHHS